MHTAEGVLLLVSTIASISPLWAASEPDTAQCALDVMTKVASNVEKAEESRRQYIYVQRVRSSLIRTNGRLSRRERREYRVTPTATGTEKQLVSFEGEYSRGKETAPYSKPGFRYKDTDIDGDLINNLTDDLLNDKAARDGIPHSLFPLRARDLVYYRFAMKGQRVVEGRKCYLIGFEPLKRGLITCAEDGNTAESECAARPWRGEIWVDTEEFQPVRIGTHLAFRIPWGVRVFLGTDLRQTGFSLSYRRVAENVWFPATYGTEFRVDALWFYKRTIVLSMENTEFQKTDVASTVRYADPQ